MKELDRNTIKKAGIDSSRSDLVVFDVGFNVGTFSLLFPNAKEIHAFEPQKSLFEKRICEPFRYNQFGLSDKKDREIKTIYVPNEFNPMCSIYNREEFKRKWDTHTEQALFISGDSYIKKMGIKHIDYLKIDVEGHEYFVFMGFEKALKEQIIDMGQFEFGGCFIDSKIDLKQIVNLLDDNGYICYFFDTEEEEEEEESKKPIPRDCGNYGYRYCNIVFKKKKKKKKKNNN